MNDNYYTSVLYTIIESVMIIYGTISICAFCFGVATLKYKCYYNIQPAILLESGTSVFIIMYHKLIQHCEYKIYDKIILGIAYMFSFAYILIGMLLVWDTSYNKCPQMIKYFAFAYFNLWWAFGIIALLSFSILSLSYRCSKRNSYQSIEDDNICV